MTGRSHILGGLAGGLLTHDITSICCTIVGSIIPDIDQRIHIKHRGLTHSIVFAFVMTLINPYLGFGVSIHIFMDMLTKGGVELFYPFWNKKLRFPFAKYIKTGGRFEKIVRYFLVIVCLYLGFQAL